MKILNELFIFSLAVAQFVQGVYVPLSHDEHQRISIKRGSDTLQNIVTFDEHSLMIYGQRIYIFSGEFHPYRLPVPGLWIDILQKIKAMGFSAVSFYIDMALLEGKQGEFRAEGIFALEPFIQAAKEAGIYLIARPGPYINAESSGGGYPGWMQRTTGQLRTRDPGYLNATQNYVSNIGAILAKAQITNGGPIILLQPENEYSQAASSDDYEFPDPYYIQYVEDQYRKAGIVVPLIGNDSGWPGGTGAPGTGIDDGSGGEIGIWDIWAHDSYPLGFDCSQTGDWSYHLGWLGFPDYWRARQENISPSTPDAIMEWQGGTFDPWGGYGYEACASLFNMEYERVFNKNNFAQAVTLMNLYMTFGGTNWGHISYPPAYTSYDYGSTIPENRMLYREKYYENKLQGNFMRVSPDYLTATPYNSTNSTYTDTDGIATSAILGNNSNTNFYIVRHSDWTQNTAVSYKLQLPTSEGNLSIPQLGGSLTLSGRDSKWHVTDYDIGGTNLLYSTAEIFTWKDYGYKKILVVYGGPGEEHELAISSSPSDATIIEGSGVTTNFTNGTVIVHWTTSSTRAVASAGSLLVYLLDRNTAYNYWVLDLERSDYWGNYTANVGNATSVVVEAGYLVRHASIEGSSLKLIGDLNASVPINVIGAPSGVTSLLFNGEELTVTTSNVTGELSSSLSFEKPNFTVPDMESLDWKYVDDLPEIQPNYDDTLWTVADLTTSNNPRNLTTPTSLYNCDYGYNAGNLIYRGTFVANGNESSIFLNTQGGAMYGDSVWLNSTYLGSFTGTVASDSTHNSTYTLPNLKAGKTYVLTVVIQNSGLEEEPNVAENNMKIPRGILNYSLLGRPQTAITWKLTGNLGGEDYIDKDRGPLNEGGLFAERQGWHQPYPPNSDWETGKPTDGIQNAGIAFYSASFDLDLPRGYDIPLSFNFGNTTIDGAPATFRTLLWVNGYQFGRYINHFGPQTNFPVPQGILDYYGTNFVALEIWAQQPEGAYIASFSLEAGEPVLTGMNTPALAPMPSYIKRDNVY